MRLPVMVAFVAISTAVFGGCATTVSRNDFINRDTVLSLLEKGNARKATATAKQITIPRVLAGMRVDNRFAPVVQKLPSHFDIDRAAKAFVDEARNEAEAKPKSLGKVIGLADSQLNVLRYQDAFDVTLAAMTKIASSLPSASFDDVGANMNWLLNQHGYALAGLHRWNEAVAALSGAASLPERGGVNVSQSINLALMSAKMGLIKEAEATLENVGGTQSPYARTQVQLAKLIIAEQTNNREASGQALEDLRANQRASVNTFQVALIEANKLDEAASFLIGRLQDFNQRFDALYEAQDFAEYYAASARAPERVRLRLDRWRTVVQRKDVQAAIAKVSKIERFKLPGRT